MLLGSMEFCECLVACNASGVVGCGQIGCLCGCNLSAFVGMGVAYWVAVVGCGCCYHCVDCRG